MRNLLALLAALLLLVGGVGWYRGWFQIHREPGEAGHEKFDFDWDSTKFSQDLDKLKKPKTPSTEKTGKENAKADKKTEAEMKAKGMPGFLPDPLHPATGPLLQANDPDPHPLVEQALLNPRKP